MNSFDLVHASNTWRYVLRITSTPKCRPGLVGKYLASPHVFGHKTDSDEWTTSNLQEALQFDSSELQTKYMSRSRTLLRKHRIETEILAVHTVTEAFNAGEAPIDPDEFMCRIVGIHQGEAAYIYEWGDDIEWNIGDKQVATATTKGLIKNSFIKPHPRRPALYRCYPPQNVLERANKLAEEYGITCVHVEQMIFASAL